MTAAARRFDLVVFDCDGVLVDSERLSIALDVEFLAGLGWPITEAEVIERWVGKTDVAMRREIEEHLGRDIGTEWDAFSERYLAAFAADLLAVDGVADAIDAIQAAGYATCVASSGGHEKIRRNLTLTGLRDRFGERIFSGEDVEHGKPAPDLFLHAARSMGVAPERTAVVEDSRHGVSAARAAGMWAFAYAGGVTPAAALEGERTTVFSEMRDLPGLIG
ncbi:MAG TPA: HAD-IA family hydrolase [Candidatus Limnocylindrales bacterium]|nr:HAD-IA family hydrolase [Candidatus Limnocylindrales bacterium]